MDLEVMVELSPHDSTVRWNLVRPFPGTSGELSGSKAMGLYQCSRVRSSVCMYSVLPYEL